VGLHRVLARQGWPDYVFAFHDGDDIGPAMLARIAKHTGLGRMICNLMSNNAQGPIEMDVRGRMAREGSPRRHEGGEGHEGYSRLQCVTHAQAAVHRAAWTPAFAGVTVQPLRLPSFPSPPSCLRGDSLFFVIASAAKQSMRRPDCFVALLLAMTADSAGAAHG
jgi:hypothetical protein